MSAEVVATADAPKVRPTRLRIWPAILLLLIMVGGKVALPLVMAGNSSPSFMLVQLLIFAPMLGAAGIALWWLFASRARWRDRLMGLGGIALLFAVAYYFLADRSMRGMPFFGFIFPNTFLAFGV